MPPANNVVDIQSFKRGDQQEIVDDIGARAFLFLRDQAEEMGVPIKDVIVEHMMGLALVMGAVEGKEEAQQVLSKISEQLELS